MIIAGVGRRRSPAGTTSEVLIAIAGGRGLEAVVGR